MASSHDNLFWRRTAPGVWQRGVDEVEAFYSTMALLYEGSGRMFFGITGFLSFAAEAPKDMTPAVAERQMDEALAKAWIKLRYDHPTLASQVTLERETQQWIKTYREFGSEGDQNDWLEKTLVPISNGQTGLQWANSDPPAPLLPTLFVVRPPIATAEKSRIRRDLVFRSPHDVIDGIGTLIMLNNFINHVSKAYDQGSAFKPPVLDGSESANLSPTYRVAANILPALTEAQKAQMAAILAQKTELKEDTEVEVLSVPFRHGAVIPGCHKRAALTLSKGQTLRLLRACKVAGVTPTHVFHTAAAMVTRDIQPTPNEAKRVRYVSYILRNERANCSEPYNTTKHPVAVYHSVSGQSIVVDMDLLPAGEQQDSHARKEDFLSIVSRMKAFYHGVRDDDDHGALAPSLWALGTPRLPPVAQSPPLPVPPPNPSPSVSISSMGRVDSIVARTSGSIRVYDAWVTGEELGNGLGLFLGTFDEELSLSAAYNDAWHTEEEVADFLQRCTTTAFEGLDVSLP